MTVLATLDLGLDSLLAGIADAVQLTATQHRDAESRYQSVGEWLAAKDSQLVLHRPSIYPQGSLNLGTTVRPLSHDEFDLDLICELQINWRKVSDPAELLDMIEARLQANARYAGMIKRRDRCVRLVYAGQFHLDIAPACPDTASGPTCIVIPGRSAHDWKAANPKGHAAWFNNRARLLLKSLEAAEPIPPAENMTIKPVLKIAVQLWKRNRDLVFRDRPDVIPASCILTTLAGHHYAGERSIASALTSILAGVKSEICRSATLEVRNPAHPADDFSDAWKANPVAYTAFCAFIDELTERWTAIRQATGVSHVSSQLSQLFGEEPTQRALKEQATKVQETRTGGHLAVRSGTGGLGVLAPGSVAVRGNTFFGG